MKLLGLTGLCLGTMLLGISAAQAAPDFTVTIVGQKQGTLGESNTPRGVIEGLKYQYSVASPRDPQSGLPNGKRQQMPVTFEKEWDSSTPQLYQALVTNENLKSVTFRFFKAGADGREEAVFIVKLTNASISAIHQHGSDQTTGVVFNEKPLEDISLTFQKIEITYVPTGFTAGDDWEATAARLERGHGLGHGLGTLLAKRLSH